MFIFQGIAALAAKIAGASTIAQAAAGLGITVAGVTGAGAAGALPGPVQDSVAHVIEVVTPFSAPHSSPVRPASSDDAPKSPVLHTVVVPTTAAVSTDPAEAPEPTSAPEHSSAAEATHRESEKSGTARATKHSSDDQQASGENESADEQHHGGTESGHEAEPAGTAPTSAAPRTGVDTSGHHSGSNSGPGSD
jgi:hypothetical protein